MINPCVRVRNPVKWVGIGSFMADVCIAYILWLFLGLFGIHRFYTGNVLTGLLWLFTGGLLGIGWFCDLFLIPGLVAAANSRGVQVVHVQQPGVAGQVAGRAAGHVATDAVTGFLENQD